MLEWLWVIPVGAILPLVLGAWIGHGLYDEEAEPKPLNYNCGGPGP